MSASKENSLTALRDAQGVWVDPDDAPELTDAQLTAGAWYDGEKEVDAATGRAALADAINRGGRPRSPNPKRAISLRLDADVVAFFRAQGRGWQSHINEVLRRCMLEK